MSENTIRYHVMEYEEAIRNLNSRRSGLSDSEVEERLREYGPNEIREEKQKTLVERFFHQFKDVMVIILVVAAVLSGSLGEFTDSAIILVVVLMNAILGVVQESKAEKALSELKKMASPYSKVRRNGDVIMEKTARLVPGDIVLVEAGDHVPADIRIIEAVNLKIDESALTGESVPVEKHSSAIDNSDIVVNDRKNMMHLGTSVTYGRGEGIVVRTGMETEVGKIAGFIVKEADDETPLQRKLAEMGKYLSAGIIAVSFFIFTVGILWGKDIFEMFLTAVSLAVAAIPEGLPAVITIVLALGVQKMARRNAIVRKLPAVETLGSVSVICSDKTGTLTLNRMKVTEVYLNRKSVKVEELNPDEHGADMLFYIATLCNDAKLREDGNGRIQGVGDPTEVALAEFSRSFNYSKAGLESKCPRHMEVPFDSERKLMTTINKIDDGYLVLTKGAADVIIEKCKKMLADGKEITMTGKIANEIYDSNGGMANRALRVLGFGYKIIDKLPTGARPEEIEDGLTFVGLVGMIDPPRSEVREAVRVCRDAGIRPVMITGDHKLTAIAIARELNIISDESEVITGAELDRISDGEFLEMVKKYSVYARVSPEHKVRIVKAWKANGRIVAMTGDGVNDAPALKSADIGVGMGITGTDVAKGVSDIVLADDNFTTIVLAVEEGRRIFDNIRKVVQFLLSCNIAEVAAIFIATLFNWTLLYPIHILWINLVTDTFPALGLGVEKAGRDTMKHPPRNSKSSIFADGVGVNIIRQGLIQTALVLTAFYIGKRMSADNDVAVTMTFLTLGLVQLFHSINVRSNQETVFNREFFSNRHLIGAVVLSAFLQNTVVLLPFMNRIFRVQSLNMLQWLIVIMLSLSIIPIVEAYKLMGRYAARTKKK